MDKPPDFEAEALSHLDSVYRFALWLSGNPAEAQDLTQETYERAWRARAGFTRTNMRAWLFTIVRRQFLNLRRHQGVMGEVALEEYDATAVADLPVGVLRRDLEDALAKLGWELSAPLLLADVEELSMAEIADALGWPIGTVKSRLWRARVQLAALLRDYRGGAP